MKECIYICNLYSLFIIIFSIWINDTMAYIVGSLIGKTPFQKFRQKKHGKEQLEE